MSNKKSIEYIDKTCVVIFREGDMYQISVLSAQELLTMQKSGEKQATNGVLVYIRCFDDVLVALGYRNVLRKLSVQSLETVIKKENPDMKALSNGLRNG